MKRIGTAIGSLVLVCLSVAAEALGDGPSGTTAPEWEWFKEVRLPTSEKPARLADFVLTPDVFDKAKPVTLGDLRLFDAKAVPIPYALRGPFENRPLRSTTERTADPAEVIVDLGEKPKQHQEIQVMTNGANFRRRLLVEGSDDRKDWKPLLHNVFLINLEMGPVPTVPEPVEKNSYQYSPSAFRYLRVRVSPDKESEDRPVINKVEVFPASWSPLEEITWKAEVGPRAPTRYGAGNWASEWIIDLGGEKAPCDRLTLDIAESEFSRSYRLEVVQPVERRSKRLRDEMEIRQPEDEYILPSSPGPPPPLRPYSGQTVMVPHWLPDSGTLARPAGDKPGPLEIRFQEVRTHRLRLVVIDGDNPPLNLKAVSCSAPARLIVFEAKPDMAQPLRLYFGNPKAEAPGWDFGTTLPAKLEPPPERVELADRTRNPEYVPPPIPWTERWPWVVYVVLGFASLALLAILAALARETIKKRDAVAAAD